MDINELESRITGGVFTYGFEATVSPDLSDREILSFLGECAPSFPDATISVSEDQQEIRLGNSGDYSTPGIREIRIRKGGTSLRVGFTPGTSPNDRLSLVTLVFEKFDARASIPNSAIKIIDVKYSYARRAGQRIGTDLIAKIGGELFGSFGSDYKVVLFRPAIAMMLDADANVLAEVSLREEREIDVVLGKASAAEVYSTLNAFIVQRTGFAAHGTLVDAVKNLVTQARAFVGDASTSQLFSAWADLYDAP